VKMTNDECRMTNENRIIMSNLKLNSGGRPLHSSFVIRHSSFLALALLFGGCSTFDTSKLPWATSEQKVKESKFQQPVRMVAIWTPTTLSLPGKPVTRGLGGRIYFYNAESEAIPVEGQLMVYAFDDSKPRKTGGGGVDEPDRKYAFTPEQFTSHFSPTDMGASYSVWIPWGPNEGPPVKVSVIPVFSSTKGNVVQPTEPSRNVLKGTIAPQVADNGEELRPEEDGVIRTDQRVMKTELRTTNIPLRESTLEHLKRAEPQKLVESRSIAPVDYRTAVPVDYRQQERAAPNNGMPPAPRAVNGPVLGVPGPWTSAQPPPIRSERQIFQAPAAPAPPPVSDRVPNGPSPTGQPYDPASLP
jgi:hypothetical protein